MEIAVFSTKSYDRQFINAATSKQHKLHYLEAQLTGDTAVLADGAGHRVRVCQRPS
jgi:D-lactate dehydrogenase